MSVRHRSNGGDRPLPRYHGGMLIGISAEFADWIHVPQLP